MFLTRIGYGIMYFIVLIYEIIKATFDVAFNS
ncbi:MAG: cation:proton antiporter, partial [Methanobrevibacter sp.]